MSDEPTAIRHTARDVIEAIRREHNRAALLPEVLAWDERCGDTPRRIDALMFRNLQRTAIEVKVTRADFRRETDDKRLLWRAITHRFVYAAPVGVIPPDEVPDGCGLWELMPTGRVLTTKRARINRDVEPLTERVVQALAYRAMKLEFAL